jgi:hypothetical protein
LGSKLQAALVPPKETATACDCLFYIGKAEELARVAHLPRMGVNSDGLDEWLWRLKGPKPSKNLDVTDEFFTLALKFCARSGRNGIAHLQEK